VEHRRESGPVSPGKVKLRGQDGERDRKPRWLEEQVKANDVDDDRRQDRERERNEQAAEEQQAGDDLGRLQQRAASPPRHASLDCPSLRSAAA
jgi:hypothetical protein